MKHAFPPRRSSVLIPIPFPLDLLTGGDIPSEIPLLTIDYLPGLIPGLPVLEEALGLNTLIDFRNCSSLDIVNPFPLTNVNTFEIDGGSNESFLLYPLSDPRFQVFGDRKSTRLNSSH